MPYTLCKAVTKRFRVQEVYGCSADWITSENTCDCLQGAYVPLGCCCAWVVPSGVRSIQVELWGAGGGGGAATANECCGTHPGGGGGSYMKYTLSVTPGETLTVCAGAGGRGGAGNNAGSSYCCCGAQGSCSFLARSGTLIASSYGGAFGSSQCYEFCGCLYDGCGSNGDTGCSYVQGSSDHGGGLELRSGPMAAFTWGCDGYCSQQMTHAGAGGWGSSPAQWNYDCNCWSYFHWQTGVTNSNSIAGHTNFCCAYNAPSGACYTCTTDQNWIYCGRKQNATNGNFPAGGGNSGVKSACCFWGGSGGHGAPGYVRITY